MTFSFVCEGKYEQADDLVCNVRSRRSIRGRTMVTEEVEQVIQTSTLPRLNACLPVDMKFLRRDVGKSI